jgi:hypothetical protein
MQKRGCGGAVERDGFIFKMKYFGLGILQMRFDGYSICPGHGLLLWKIRNPKG